MMSLTVEEVESMAGLLNRVFSVCVCMCVWCGALGGVSEKEEARERGERVCERETEERDKRRAIRDPIM